MKGRTEREEDSKEGNENFLFSLYQKFKKHEKNKNDEAETNAENEQDTLTELSEEPMAETTERQPFSLLALQQMSLDCAQKYGFSPREPCIESFLGDFVPDNKEVEDLLQNLDREAQNVLQAVEKTADVEPRPKVNGRVLIYISQDGMQAWAFVFPPLFGGEPVNHEEVLNAMHIMQVKAGIDEDAVSKLTQESVWLHLIRIAAGTAPENGIDGRIEEVIPHTVGTPYMESSSDIVDYKNLNWIVHVQEKEVICKIIPPTPGKPGISVLGKEIPCTSGKKPPLPVGKNTQLSEDGTEIIAKTDGQIFYENDQYRVTDVIQIKGDVDLSTGNIDVKGNVFVQGNVRDGFWVKATGDVNISGSVGAATVQAGGSLFVRSGINGSDQGRLQAGGDVKCRYIESAEVQAGGSVFADSISNSNISCNGSAVVESGHGVIVGGSITAMEEIRAKEVGNERGLVTRLNLERTPEHIAQKTRVTKEYETVKEQVHTAKAQLKALDKSDDPEIVKAVKDIHFRLSIFLVKQDKLKQQMDEIQAREEKLSYAKMKISTLYPTVAARINGISRLIIGEETNCLIFQSDTDLEIGRFS